MIPEPTYDFEHNTITSKYSIKMKNGGPLMNCHKYSEKFDCFFLDSPSGSKVACVWIKNFEDPKYTILFSHGGVIDLGTVINFLFILSQRLSVNVLIYDYGAWGVSSGKASESSIYEDAEAVYKHLNETVPKEKIILYGQSMGTAPSLHLATMAPRTAKALILHSPFLSAAKLYFPKLLSRAASFYDFFKKFVALFYCFFRLFVA